MSLNGVPVCTEMPTPWNRKDVGTFQIKEKWPLNDHQSLACVLKEENAIETLTGLADESGVQDWVTTQRQEEMAVTSPILRRHVLHPGAEHHAKFIQLVLTWSYPKFQEALHTYSQILQKKRNVYKLEKKQTHRWEMIKLKRQNINNRWLWIKDMDYTCFQTF